jgi:hypothetical protein
MVVPTAIASCRQETLLVLAWGRAYSLRGDSAGAYTASQDFLNFWKDTDPDIPILKQAKAEYTKLQQVPRFQ